MVGLPGQTLRDLAGDVLFFRDLGADMIGMVGALFALAHELSVVCMRLAARHATIPSSPGPAVKAVC